MPCFKLSDDPVHISESSEETSLYVETMHPGSWSQLERSCQASGGFLISLASEKVEREIVGKTELPSFWCGGNMCPDSPAPPDSLWSSGEHHINYTNFASDSLLDSRRCCIKVDLMQESSTWANDSSSSSSSSSSVWKGEDCESVLKGICQFRVGEYLDRPVNLSGTSTLPTAIKLRWETEGRLWQPGRFSARACHRRSLSPASLPVAEEERCRGRNISGEEGRERKKEGRRRAWAVEVGELRPFSEYEVVVVASLDSFQETKLAEIKARTRKSNRIYCHLFNCHCADTDVMMIIATATLVVAAAHIFVAACRW